MKTRERRPHDLLDAVIDKQRLRNDSHLAEEMNVTPATIWRMRHGQAVTSDFRLALVRQFGMTIKEIDKLAPPAKEKA